MQKGFVGISAAALCVAVAAWTWTANAAEMRPILTMDVAQKMANACLEKAAQEGWKMHVAIVDNGGNLKLYTRMDDSMLVSQQIAIAKATTSAKLPRSTKQLQESAFKEQGPTPLAFVPGLQFFEGGLPIKTADGVHLGGIGVSGSSGENDGICAQAALDAAKQELM